MDFCEQSAEAVHIDMKRKKHKTPPKPSPLSFVERSYRQQILAGSLVSSYVKIEETDLHILADCDVTTAASELVLRYRHQLEGYIRRFPHFLTSLEPLPDDPHGQPIIREMLQAAILAEVGPMAAVAGAIAEYVGRGLQELGSAEVIVENGGDIFLARSAECVVEIFAGASPLSRTVGVRLPREKMPCSVCTSSGTIGHSLSFGSADAVTVVAQQAALADAVATRIGNEVGDGRGADYGIANALNSAKNIDGIDGVVIICGSLMGAIGNLELIRLHRETPDEPSQK